MSACAAVLSAGSVPSAPLWHYTGADGLRGIVQDVAIHATHYRFTNDESELVEGEAATRRACVELAKEEGDPVRRTLFTELADFSKSLALTKRTDVFIACLTEAKDSLVQWSGYRHRGTGYAIALRLSPTHWDPDADELDASVMFAQVIYNRKAFIRLVKQQLLQFAVIHDRYRSYGNAAMNAIQAWMLQECASLSPRLKQACFAHEREWRIIVSAPREKQNFLKFRSRPDGTLVPFVSLPLESGCVAGVCCGPAHAGQQEAKVMAARLLLREHGYAEHIVRPSGIPFCG